VGSKSKKQIAQFDKKNGGKKIQQSQTIYQQWK
jgi:hypothetical protein